jgi:hypothetical protein
VLAAICKRPAIVELQPAKAAMVEPPTRHSLQQVQNSPLHFVDLVAFPQFHRAKAPAPRAAGTLSKVVGIMTGGKFFYFTGGTFINSHVTEAFHERPMYPLHSLITLLTFPHPALSFITQLRKLYNRVTIEDTRPIL